MSQAKEKITKEMTIQEAVQKHPKTVHAFLNYGLHCIGCPMAPDETIEEAAQVHKLDLNKLLEDLNKAASND